LSTIADKGHHPELLLHLLASAVQPRNFILRITNMHPSLFSFGARSLPVARVASQLSAIAILLLTLSVIASAQSFSYAAINVPGAIATEARGINNNGEIVGFYKTVACTDYDIKVPSCPVKGFKYVNGSYVKLMVPNSVSTAILGVNDLGDLVGFYKKSDGSQHGFIWYHTNVVKTIDHPSTTLVTVPFGINKAGTVVGGLWTIKPSFGTFASSGWVWVNGTFSNMNPFTSGAAGPCCWSVNGIANSGVIVGQVFQADFFNAWFKQGTDQDFFMQFASGLNGGDTFAMGVNSGADIVGYGSEGWFAKSTESNEGTSDATETKPSFITVKYPNSQFTIPFGVNNLRGVVGTYTDSSGKQHGFMAKANL
jgi:hypothetical protein